MTVIEVLHPGKMGAAVNAALVGVGIDVVWLPAGRSADTHARATAAGMRAVDDLAGVDLVLSICPPGAALELANVVAQQRFSGTYVDANAVSPATAHEVDTVVTAAGAAYVDGGIIGPPPHQAGTGRRRPRCSPTTRGRPQGGVGPAGG